MKTEIVEGSKARENFERAMKAAFRVSKEEIKAAEKKGKASRKRRRR